jgi:hypothetical protein
MASSRSGGARAECRREGDRRSPKRPGSLARDLLLDATDSFSKRKGATLPIRQQPRTHVALQVLNNRRVRACYTSSGDQPF